MKVRQMKTMEDHPERICQALHTQVGEKIYQELKRYQRNACRLINNEIDTCGNRAGKALYNLAGDMCNVDRRMEAQSITFPAVQELKRSVRDDVESWKKHWWTLDASLPVEDLSLLGEGPDEMDVENEDDSEKEEVVNYEPEIKKEGKKRQIKTEESNDEMPPYKAPRN